LMARAWEGMLKSPMTLVREELARRYIRFRDVNDTFVRYDILTGSDVNQQEPNVAVAFRGNCLFFTVDLMIECPDDVEILANVAAIAYDLYSREAPYFGRLLIKDDRTYYQLVHILGAGRLDPAMVSMLLDIVTKEVLEVIDEKYAME
jgi:hypothetical protein